jgi:hypothetical protein
MIARIGQTMKAISQRQRLGAIGKADGQPDSGADGGFGQLDRGGGRYGIHDKQARVSNRRSTG